MITRSRWARIPAITTLCATTAIACAQGNASDTADKPGRTEIKTQAPPAGTFAFTNVSVIPMNTERVLNGQTVIVRDGKILSVGAAATAWVDRLQEASRRIATSSSSTSRTASPQFARCSALRISSSSATS